MGGVPSEDCIQVAVLLQAGFLLVILGRRKEGLVGEQTSDSRLTRAVGERELRREFIPEVMHLQLAQ